MADSDFTPTRAVAQPLITGPWTAEETDLLRAWYPLVCKGRWTARDIAHFLDRTRNSVIARANRMGLGERKPR